jgi:uncharacterized protein (TIGR01244 family)
MAHKTITILFLTLAVACSSGEGVEPTRVAAAAEAQPTGGEKSEAGGSLEPASDAVGIPNERTPADGLLTGGQVTQEQMTRLAEMGYTTFINLRPAGEDGTGWEEEFAAGQGVTFTRIPVASSSDLNRENVELLSTALAEGTGKAVVYCKSGNRVGALLALKAFWIDGVGAEEAMAFGREAGVTRLEPAVQKIIAAQE